MVDHFIYQKSIFGPKEFKKFKLEVLSDLEILKISKILDEYISPITVLVR